MSQNPYQSPTPSAAATDKLAPPILAKTAAIFAQHLILLIVIGLILLFVVPHFDRMLLDFQLKLPAPTLLVLALSRLVVKFWYLAMIVLPLYFLFLLGTQSTDRRFAGLALIWSIFFWLGGLAFLIGLMFALAIPFLQLMSNLSK